MIILAILFSFFIDQTHADRITDMVPSNARAQGMGMAGINSLNDSYAMFYNPANLAEKRNKPKIELINVQGELSEYSINALGGRHGSPLSLGSVYDYLKSSAGEWTGYRFNIYPNFTSRFISFGVLYEQDFAAKYDGPDPDIVGDEAKVTQRGYRRIMPTAAASFRMLKGILRFGYSIAVEYLGEVSATVTKPDGKSLSYTNGIQEGTAVRQTAGLTMTLPFQHLPSFSVVARDIAGSRYFGGSLDKVRKMTIDGGFSHTTYFGQAMDLKITADYRDTLNQTETNAMRRIFAGAELVLGHAISIRGGYGQGYPSAGLGFRVKKTKIDLSWYSQEMGDRLRDDRDQRVGLHITMSLGN